VQEVGYHSARGSDVAIQENPFNRIDMKPQALVPINRGKTVGSLARCVLVTLWGIGHEKIPRAGP
jgi:hypothetical protein